MTLCLGPIGSGKTLLLKNLQNEKSVDDTTSSVPTVGVNIFNVKCSNGSIVTIKEVGGAMAPLWSQYFTGIKHIIYVVDASDLCQISAAGVLLYSLLVHPDLSNTRVKKCYKFNRINLLTWNSYRYCWFLRKWTLVIGRCVMRPYWCCKSRGWKPRLIKILQSWRRAPSTMRGERRSSSGWRKNSWTFITYYKSGIFSEK